MANYKEGSLFEDVDLKQPLSETLTDLSELDVSEHILDMLETANKGATRAHLELDSMALEDSANYYTKSEVDSLVSGSTPTLATVATTGSYNDLINKPSIPTQYTDEMAQDAALGVIGATGGVNFNYNDGANTANITLTYGTTSNTVAQGNDSRIVNAVPNTRTINGQALSSDVTLTKSSVGLGNVDNTADSAKSFSASQITSGTFADARIAQSNVTQHQGALSIGASQITGTKTSSFISDFGATVRSNTQCYTGTTQRLGAFPIFKSGTVASGTVTFHLTNDGLSTGTALFPNGVIEDSIALIVNDATASYQFGWAFSNSNKTLTVTANKLTTANILTGVLGQGQANTSVVRLGIWGY